MFSPASDKYRPSKRSIHKIKHNFSFCPVQEELTVLRVLSVIPAVLGIIFTVTYPNYEQIHELAYRELKRISNSEEVQQNAIIRTLTGGDTIKHGKLVLNCCTEQELQYKLGISKAAASAIVKEASRKNFENWSDFAARVPQLASEVKDFIKQGASLSGE